MLGLTTMFCEPRNRKTRASKRHEWLAIEFSPDSYPFLSYKYAPILQDNRFEHSL